MQALQKWCKTWIPLILPLALVIGGGLVAWGQIVSQVGSAPTAADMALVEQHVQERVTRTEHREDIADLKKDIKDLRTEVVQGQSRLEQHLAAVHELILAQTEGERR